MPLSKPKSIEHSHILESIVEIRFQPAEDDAFLKLLMHFKTKYPDYQFKLNEVPEPLRARDMNLRNQPKGKLFTDEYLIAIGDHSISFNCTNTYKTWDNFFPFIQENLEDALGLSVISRIERIGLRYINFFEGTNDLYELLNVSFQLDIKSPIGLTHDQVTYRTVLSDESGKLNVHLANRTSVANRKNEGILLDIDSYSEKKMPVDDKEQLLDTIVKLHDRETDIFFSLMRSDYIDKLDPKY